MIYVIGIGNNSSASTYYGRRRASTDFSERDKNSAYSSKYDKRRYASSDRKGNIAHVSFSTTS